MAPASHMTLSRKLTGRDCGHSFHPGDSAGLPGLSGGAEGIRTSDLREAGARAGRRGRRFQGANTPEGAPLDPTLDRPCFP